MSADVRTSPKQVWQVPVGFSLNAPLLADGQIYFVEDIVDGNGKPIASQLQSVDIQSQVLSSVWVGPLGMLLSSQLTISNGVAYLVDQAGTTLFAVELASQRLRWRFAIPPDPSNSYGWVGTPVVAGGYVLILVRDTLHALTLDGTRVWWYLFVSESDQKLYRASTPLVTGKSVLVWALFGSETTPPVLLYSIDLASGNLWWSYNTESYPAADPAVGGDLVALPCTDSTLHGLSLSTGARSWLFRSSEKPFNFSGRPAIADGVVYIGAMSGVFYAIDGTSGQERWRLNADNMPIRKDVSVRAGVGYFVTERVSGDHPYRLFAVDLVEQDSLVFSLPNDPKEVSQPTVQTGTMYVYQKSASSGLLAVDMGNVLHEFFIESELMVEDYDVSGSQPLPRGTSFRTSVVVMDEHKCPRPLQPIKLSASAPVTLTVAGQRYDLRAGQPIWVTTDKAGALSIVSEATGLTAPALSLWGSFMSPAESIVVYPDEGSTRKLSQVSAADLDPSRARGYDGTPVLKKDYQSEDQRTGIAQVVRNLLGQQVSASASASSSRYIAYPQSMLNTVYEASGQARPRSLRPGEINHWRLRLGDKVEFTPLVDDSPLSPVGPMGFFSEIGDFVKHVVEGPEKIAEMTWDFTRDSAEAVIRTAENLYKLTLATVEDAVQVLLGVLKEVIQDIKLVIQWLSYLFDWPAMLATHRAIKSQIGDRLGQLESWLQDEVNNGFVHTRELFARLEAGVETALDQVIAAFEKQQTSLESARKGRTDPTRYFNAGGAQSYVRSQWLPSKLGMSSGASSMAASGGDPLVEAFEVFFNDAKTIVEQQFPRIGQDLERVFGGFEALLTDPSSFVDVLLSRVLALFRDLAVTVIKLGGAVVEGFITLLKALLQPLLELLRTPIDVPVVSDLYWLLTQEKLSALDFCALVVAVPTTLVCRALDIPIGGSAAAVGSPMPKWLYVAYTLSYFFYGVTDVAVDVSSTPDTSIRVSGFINAALSTILLGLGGPWSIGSMEFHDFELWVFQFAPLALSVAGLVAAEGSELGQFISESGDMLNCVLGILLELLYALWAIGWPDQYLGKDGLALVENVASALPYVAKPLGRLGDAGRGALVIVDLAGDGTAFYLSKENNW